MPSGQRSRPPTRFTHYVSEHRFGLMMLVCGLVLAAELAVVHGLGGFTLDGSNNTAVGVP